MAGAGRKTFVAGAVLTASDVNTYLMDQAVMRFATASARSTALPTPSEGMMSYLDDTNQVEVYDGSSWGQVSASIGALPVAMSVLTASFGSLTVPPVVDGSAGTVGTVTFPASRFTVAPIVMTSTVLTGVTRSEFARFQVNSVTASAVTLWIQNAGPSASVSGGGTVTDCRVNVTALQYATGSATG